ncbi:class I SAM-dependent methyltransferase [Microlunatus speluncae]|uniref:class I SAM-dependent methyltransferase n=1 Tax=Microlunatus speluncae TaxID=2594267 RepID=UPI001266255C|nr:class I SAM-dependent methyltransferase [Microlunatus speluncae]
MEPATAEALTTAEGTAAIELALAQPDPDGLAAAAALRRSFPPELAAAALTQAGLWRTARGKFGDLLDRLPGTPLLTPAGLQQATRAEVAAHHAARFELAGATRVFDLGCGIGADAMAFALAGLAVTAVERDPATAVLARHNLDLARRAAGPGASEAEVIIADLADDPVHLGVGDGVYLDPARRSSAGRTWRPEDFSPPWSRVQSLLRRAGPTAIKLGPGLPHELIEDDVEAEWISAGGDAVEVGLWSGTGAAPGRWSALIMPDLRIVAEPVELPVSPPLRYVYEPLGAVIRARAIGTLGRQLDASLLDEKLAYLTSDRLTATPAATAFEVIDVLPYTEKVLRAWVREHRIGSLEIKQRGIDLDPALLRRKLKPRGPEAATILITRTPTGARTLVVRRIP